MKILLNDYNDHQFILYWCEQLDEFTGNVINEYHSLQDDRITSGTVSEAMINYDYNICNSSVYSSFSL